MDWDLQAIVGCTKAPAATVMDNPHLIFSQHFCPEEQDDLLCNFQEFSETTTVVDELEELYKPSYPRHVHDNPLPVVANSPPILDEKVKELKPSDKTASRCKKRYSSCIQLNLKIDTTIFLYIKSEDII